MSLYDLVWMTTTTTGTGTITLGSAVPGYLTFDQASIADGVVVSYRLVDGTNSEVGHGTYGFAGKTLTRTVVASTSSGNPINLSGSAQIFITVLAEDIPLRPNLQVFTSSGTWTKPPWATIIRVRLIGGGGGGGGGALNSGATLAGGGGGGAGWYSGEVWFNATSLSSSVAVTVGAGGTGGAGSTSNSFGGNNGGQGGQSSFGALVVALGGGGGAGALVATS